MIFRPFHLFFGQFDLGDPLLVSQASENFLVLPVLISSIGEHVNLLNYMYVVRIQACTADGHKLRSVSKYFTILLQSNGHNKESFAQLSKLKIIQKEGDIFLGITEKGGVFILSFKSRFH